MMSGWCGVWGLIYCLGYDGKQCGCVGWCGQWFVVYYGGGGVYVQQVDVFQLFCQIVVEVDVDVSEVVGVDVCQMCDQCFGVFGVWGDYGVDGVVVFELVQYCKVVCFVIVVQYDVGVCVGEQIVDQCIVWYVLCLCIELV